MIARIRPTEVPPRSPAMRRAHRLVASTLLKKRPDRSNGRLRISAWKAWLFAGWVVVVTVVYAAYMIGVL